MQNDHPHNLSSVSPEAFFDRCEHSTEELWELQQNNDIRSGSIAKGSRRQTVPIPPL